MSAEESESESEESHASDGGWKTATSSPHAGGSAPEMARGGAEAVSEEMRQSSSLSGVARPRPRPRPVWCRGVEGPASG